MNNIIEGINVFEKTSIKEYTTLSGILLVLGIFIAVVSIFITMFKSRDTKDIDIKSAVFKRFLFCYVFGIVMILFSIIRFPWFYVETGKYIYKCNLEDSVSANYISNNFNIVGVEDGVWTIEDK